MHLSGMYMRKGMVVKVGVFYIVLGCIEVRLNATTPAVFLSLLGRYFVVVKSQNLQSDNCANGTNILSPIPNATSSPTSRNFTLGRY